MKLSLAPFLIKRFFRIKVLAVVFAASTALSAEALAGRGHHLSDAVCVLAAIPALGMARNFSHPLSSMPESPR
jgi:Co/Zn/Cd efflux system component